MQYLTVRDVRKKLGNRSRTSLWRDVKEGRLPPPIKLGQRVYWPEKSIDDAMQKLAEAQR